MHTFRGIMEIAVFAIDGFGVLIIIVGAVISTSRFLPKRTSASYRKYRQDLGRSILLGLEFLIAGDIIRTVVVAPSLENVIVLGIVVLIRIILSITLYMEIEGRWPWQPDDRLSHPSSEGSERL
jgi:uncharacterized membrane protein